MESDIEKLNMELIQAQMLLRASHDLFEDILVEVTRQRLSGKMSSNDEINLKISARITKFSQRDDEIRRQLLRLNKLGKPQTKIA